MFNKNGLGKTALYVMLTMFLGLFVLIAAVPQSAFAATTELTITKYANDGKTILKQEKINYNWLENNIDVMGDGETHYYHQGPVFIDDPDEEMQELLRWNEEEDQNWDTKDMGAVKGTNVKDLCELVGGMAEGDTLQIKASDGFKKTFAYKNVYQYSDREGPMVVCWYKDGKYPDTGYSDGMRLVWFAKATYKEGPTSIEKLPSGYYHVFGNWDWHEAADHEYWYYYNNQYPTTTGLSVQNIAQLNIYSNEPVPSAAPVLTADTEDNEVGQAVEITFTDDATWRAAITGITVEGTALTGEQYTVNEGKISINADVFTAAGDYAVVVKATGYSNATVTQTMAAAPNMDVLYDGSVTLSPDKTFTVTVSETEYTVNKNTPLGALQASAEAGGFTYALSDKRWSYDGVLLLDDVGQYVRKSPGYWYAYVNGVYKDGYQNNPDGLNVIELVDGDKVEFYYAAGISDPTDLNTVRAAAIAAVKTLVALSTTDIIYDGTVNLDPEEEFTVTAYNSGTEYTVNENTPLGALHKAAIISGFTYDVTDKNYSTSGALLLDRIADYNYVKNGSAWYAYVNGALKDGYNNPAGALNLIQLADGDKVEFYYADVEDETDFNAVKAAATAAVKTVVVNGVVPTDWTLQLSGARNENVTKAYFEQGLACPLSGHQVTWTDEDENVWGGIPLWLLVAMVDDDPDEGDYHFNFNDELADEGYEVKVI
ncbi:MAG: DUF1533 domain-containing protein, partial [Syntrophomonadaceae bacterium]